MGTTAITKSQYRINSPENMAKMATVLKNHIVKHKLYTTIVGKNYAHVEGWQFAGGLLGIFPVVTEVKDLGTEKELKWQAEVEIQEINTGRVVGRGFALCSNKENKKKTFDEYAVLSMAQTRAIGKGFRNMLGWVMKLAGYEGTPKEEMTAVGETTSNGHIEPAQRSLLPGPDYAAQIQHALIARGQKTLVQQRAYLKSIGVEVKGLHNIPPAQAPQILATLLRTK